MSETIIGRLHPVLQKLAALHIQKCKEAGIELKIYQTYRTSQEQNTLYAQGRSAPGPIVTNARGGESYHNYGLAYDCGPVVSGQVAWHRHDLFRKIGEIGESLGLEWGGRWKMRDYPHFQFTFGASIDDLKSYPV